MDPNRRSGLVVAAGVVLVAAPAYVGALAALGVAVVVDPLGALGVVPRGVQPAGIGGAYLAVGATLLATDDDWTLVRAVGVAVAGILAATGTTVVAWLVATGTVGVGPTFVGGTFGVVALGLLYGAHDDEEDRVRIAGVVVVAVATFAAYVQLRAILQRDVPGAPVYLVVAGHLVFDALFASPLYLAGLPLIGGSGEPPDEAGGTPGDEGSESADGTSSGAPDHDGSGAPDEDGGETER
jgi:hypothetical protein